MASPQELTKETMQKAVGRLVEAKADVGLPQPGLSCLKATEKPQKSL